MKKRPSYGPAALFISIVALVFAMVGTALSVGSAVPGKNGVKASDIAAGAVKQPKIATGAVGSAQLADGAVNGAKLLDGAVGAADLGSGAVGSSKLGTITERTLSLDDGDAAVNGTYTVSVGNIGCNAGERVISGGYRTTSLTPADLDEFAVIANRRFPTGEGWQVIINTDEGGAADISAYALCLQP